MEGFRSCSFPIVPICAIFAIRQRNSFVSAPPQLFADAQFQIARQYGFPSWPKLKQHVESLNEAGQLGQAIDAPMNSRASTNS